jgi:hypothetical protein
MDEGGNHDVRNFSSPAPLRGGVVGAGDAGEGAALDLEGEFACPSEKSTLDIVVSTTRTKMNGGTIRV